MTTKKQLLKKLSDAADAVRERVSNYPPEVKAAISEQMRWTVLHRTPESRSKGARKGWETRRRNLEKKLAAEGGK